MYERYMDRNEEYCVPVRPPPQIHREEREKEGVLDLVKPLLEKLHMPDMDFDDILLLLLVYLLLKESGDEGLIFIVAALYLFGK